MARAAPTADRSSALSLQGAVLILAACAIGAWVFALWFVSQVSSSREFTYRVSEVVEGPDPAHPYGIEVDGGGTFSFRRPPGLDPGDTILARYDRAGQFLGWSAYGRYTAKTDPPSKLVFFLPIAIPICLTWVAVYVARGERLPRGESS